jgi:hypothetical protein
MTLRRRLSPRLRTLLAEERERIMPLFRDIDDNLDRPRRRHYEPPPELSDMYVPPWAKPLDRD